MKSAKPILVTGSHRSGTTWVGNMIATSSDVTYIHEPFNLNHDLRICKAQFDYWFTYICEQNERKYYRYIKDTIDFRYDLLGALKSNRHPRYVINQVKKWGKFAWCRVSHVRPLLKDPIAIFSAEWLSSRFNMNTVVMIRHPAAFAGSLKEKNWTHPFSHFINQPLLMEEHLQPFEKKIIEFAKEEKDIIDQAALLWNLVHFMILKYRRSHPEWKYIRHEDLSRNPLDGFSSLFQNLELDFSEHTSDAIKSHSFAHMATDLLTVINSNNLKRDSLKNIYTWKERLTNLEIKKLKSQVQEISKEFYAEDEW